MVAEVLLRRAISPSSRSRILGLYSDHILPRGINWVMGKREFAVLRQQYLQGLSGKVLELGFGSGLNVPHYPDTVTKIFAVDPSLLGRKLAAKRVAASPIPVTYAGLNGETLELPDNSVNAVLSTWTLCTIPHLPRALAEVRRVLRPGGQLHFLEHGLCPDESVARWQHRLNPLQKRMAGGCQLNREIPRLVAESGLALGEVETFFMKGPRFAGYMFAGIATND
jgi:ubiquinone/menaquinone biosynthesis C-methylase UbiE